MRYSLFRLQFSLTHTALGVILLAVVCALWKAGATITDSISDALTLWVAIGLFAQARDITLAAPSDRADRSRFGHQFAAAWRMAAGVLLCVCVVLAFGLPKDTMFYAFAHRGMLDGDYDCQVTPSQVRETLSRSIVVIVLLTLAAPRTIKACARHRLIAMIGGVAGATLFLLYSVLALWNCGLVYFAIQGPEHAFPGIRESLGLGSLPFLAEQGFMRIAAVLGLLLCVQLFAMVRLSRQAQRRPSSWCYFILWFAAACVMGASIAWALPQRLKELRPEFYQTLHWPPISEVFLAAAIILVLVTAASTRLVQERNPRSPPLAVLDRRYAHESRFLHLMLGVFVPLAALVEVGLRRHWLRGFDAAFLRYFYSYGDDIIRLMSPDGFLLWIVPCVALITAMRPVYAWQPLEVSAPRFFRAWLMLLITIVLGLPTLAALGFALWLTPWYKL